MNVEIPADFAPFVERLISERRFLSPDDVVLESLRMLQERETLREEVAKGFVSLDAGRIVSADVVYAKAKAKIASIEQEKRSCLE